MDFYSPILYNNMEGKFCGTEGLFYSKFGRVYYVYAGKGECLLLLHNLGPGMSSFEWKMNYDMLCENFCVYAVDLPGYARSEKRSYVYTAPVYVQFIKEFIRKKIKKPVFIVASGMSAAYAVFAAQSLKGYVKGILLSAPAASVKDYIFFDEIDHKKSFIEVYSEFCAPQKLKEFAQECISKNATEEEMMDEMLRCALKQPNAEYAPSSFMMGYGNVKYEHIQQGPSCPICAVCGDGRFLMKSLKTAQRHNFNNNITSPHIERPDEFFSVVKKFADINASNS